MPKSFWTTQASIKIGSAAAIQLTSERGRVFDRKKCEAHTKEIEKMKTARITELSHDSKSVSRPHALNTVELLKVGSAKLGMSPSDTMHTAEWLYISGYISYPRTETSQYPENFDITSLVKSQQRHPLWGEFCRDLLSEGQGLIKRPEGGYVGLPTILIYLLLAKILVITRPSRPQISSSGRKTWLIGNGECMTMSCVTLSDRYPETATTHVPKQLSKSERFSLTRITLKDSFSWAGNRVTKPGFTGVMHWKQMSNEEFPVEMEKDREYEICNVGIKEGQTEPPPYLSESDLIELMETHGIGTDASMAVHINSVTNRRFVNVVGTRRSLVPTNLGIVVIHGIQKIDSDLASHRFDHL